jgi:autotransporter translocation and assembly factor TamB
MFQHLSINAVGKLTDGLYYNPGCGTLYKMISSDILIKNKKLILSNILGYDTTSTKYIKKNPITGEGSISFLSLLEIPILALRLNLNNNIIADEQDFFSKASGYLTLNGPLNQLKVEGEINLIDSKLALEKSGDTSIAKIKVINKKKKPEKEKKKYSYKNPLLPLNIKVLVEKDYFSVKGFGLNSKWVGALMVKGCITDPCLVGKASIKSGFINLMGRRLKIASGSIIYSQENPKEPILKLIGYRNIDETSKVFINIEGKTSDPKIRFSSNNGLSEEDTFSTILFDRQSPDISVLQAIQLTTSLAALKGQKSLDLQEKLRKIFKLSHIGMKEYRKKDDEYIATGKALSIAKEIGKVTISIEQGASSDSSRFKVLTPISKNIHIEAGTGTGSGIECGINWAKRY